MPTARAFLLLCAALALVAAGCRDAKVTAYRAPKDPPRATMADTTVPTASGDDLAWTAPADWVAQPATDMRKATYLLKGNGDAQAELAITMLAGDAGGELRNLNRWRDQIKLPELATADSAPGVTRLEQSGLKLTVADFGTLPPALPQRMFGVMVPFHNQTWFFKLTGPATLLDQEKNAFLDFVKTIRPAAPFTTDDAPFTLPLPEHGQDAHATSAAAGGTMSGTTVPVASGAELRWSAPADWRVQPANSMRKATYALAGDGGAQAELAISAFPGDVGGELLNLNRWRAEVHLPELSDAASAPGVTRFEQGGLKFTVADFSSVAPAPPARMLVALVPFGGATWFFKFTGPPALLEQEKAAFLAFLHTVKAP